MPLSPALLLELAPVILAHLDSTHVMALTRSCRSFRCIRRELLRALVRAHIIGVDHLRYAVVGKNYFRSAPLRFVLSRAASAVAAFDFRAFFRREMRVCFENPHLSMAPLRTYLLNGAVRMRNECVEHRLFETREGRQFILQLSGAPDSFRYATHHTIPIQYPSADARWAVQVLVDDLKHLARHSFYVDPLDRVAADVDTMSPVLGAALERIGDRPPRWLKGIVEFDILMIIDVTGSAEEEVRRFVERRVQLQ